MRRVAFVAVLVALSSAPSAYANAFTAPTLTAAGRSQRGAMVHATVNTAQSKGRCVAHHADYTGVYPEPMRHDGSAVTWRLADARRPASTVVTLWRLGTDREGLGTAENVPLTLTPERSGSRTVAWLAKTGAVGVGDLHLDLTVTWPKGKCGKDQGGYRYRLLSAI